MAYTDFTFDGTGVNPANLVTEEPLVIDGAMLVTDSGAFYQDGTIVEGYNGVTWAVLNANEHYSFSPVFHGVTSSTGLFAFSYLVIMPSTETFTAYRITTNYVGAVQDDKLIGLIAGIDRSKYYDLLRLEYSIGAHYKNRHPDIEEKSFTEALLMIIQSLEATIIAANGNSDASLLTRIQALEGRVFELEKVGEPV